MREKAIQRLLENWRSLVKNGEFDAEEMIESLTEQVEHASQGWDASLEEFESDPELYDIMGYNEDLTDEQVDEWQKIVEEAARMYLNEAA